MVSFPEIAYSTDMQRLLFALTGLTTVVNHVALTSLIVRAYGQTVPRWRKWAFALILALMLDQVWIYGIYALGSFADFPSFVYALVVHPNPVFALVYYWLGVRVLGLSKYRSVHLMRMAYLYVLILRCVGELISGLIINILGSGDGRYNYLMDIICSAAGMCLYLLIYAVVRAFFHKNKQPIQLFDSLPVKSIPYEILVSFAQGSVAYAVCIMVPYYFKGSYFLRRDVALVVEIVFFVLLLLANIVGRYCRTVWHAIDNKNTNIAVLVGAVNEFSGLKHDFFNILQAYEGYIAMGDLDKLKQYHKTLRHTAAYVSGNLDLAHHLSQNTELTSLLLQKQQQAADAGMQLTLKILCNISDFYIPREDICRAVSLLLDTWQSQCTGEGNTIFSVEQKPDGTKLAMINSSNQRKAEQDGPPSFATPLDDVHTVMEVRRILYRHNNVFFHSSYSNQNFFAYVELRPTQK